VTLQIEAQARRLLTQIGRSGLVLPESETLNGYNEAKFVTKVTDNTCGSRKNIESQLAAQYSEADIETSFSTYLQCNTLHKAISSRIANSTFISSERKG
jgi:hypothetical protein